MRVVKGFTVLLFFSFFVLPLYGQENEPSPKPLELTLEAGFGMGFGTFHELVLPPSGHESPYLSELIWDVQPIPSVVFGAELLMFKKLKLAVSGSIYFPGECGKMDDYDWLYHNIDDWTHHSESKNILDGGFTGDVQITWRILQNKGFWFDGGISCGMMVFEFSDRMEGYTYTTGLSGDGLDVYTGVENFRDNVVDGDGDNYIDYRILTVTPGLIISAGYRFRRIEFMAVVSWSPLAYYWGTDKHLARDLEFNDTVSPWHALMGGLSGRFYITEKLFLKLSGDINWYPEGYGDSYITNNATDTTSLAEDSIGFSGLFFQFGLACGYTF